MVSVREGGLLVRWCCRVRTKEDEKKGAKKEEQESVLVQQRRQGKIT